MAWTGTWQNQYGSRLIVRDDRTGQLHGTFRTALRDSGFFGRDQEIIGLHYGDCVSFAFAGPTPKGDMVCAFAGVLRDGKLQTVWHVVSDGQPDVDGTKRPWPQCRHDQRRHFRAGGRVASPGALSGNPSSAPIRSRGR